MKLRKSVISDVTACLEVVADVFKAERIKTKLDATEVLLKKLASQVGVKEFELVLFLEEHGKEKYHIYMENVFEIPSKQVANLFATKVIGVLKAQAPRSDKEEYLFKLGKQLNVSKAYLLFVIFNVSDFANVFKATGYDVLKYTGNE